MSISHFKKLLFSINLFDTRPDSNVGAGHVSDNVEEVSSMSAAPAPLTPHSEKSYVPLLPGEHADIRIDIFNLIEDSDAWLAAPKHGLWRTRSKRTHRHR